MNTRRKHHILVVDDSKMLLRMAAEMLTAAGFHVTTALCAEDALAVLTEHIPDLVVSDVSMPGMDGYEFCRRLKANPQTAHLPVIMLTARADISEKVKGFEAGADDYIVKPFEHQELILRINALLARAGAAQAPVRAGAPQGRLISVFSLRGGAGKTTLATNLAVSLAQLWKIEVVLVDLALESDHIAMMLNLKPKLTWDGLAGVEMEDLDDEVVMGHLTPHGSGVKVLAAPPSPVTASLVTPRLVDQVLSVLQARFKYVIVDMPSNFAEMNLITLDHSDLIIVVVTPELAGLKGAKTTLEIFRTLGYGEERVALVLNHTIPRKALPQRHIEAALAAPIDLVLDYEMPGFVDALNTGVPYVLGAPTGRTSMELQKFAYHLSAAEMEGAPGTSDSHMLARVRIAVGK